MVDVTDIFAIDKEIYFIYNNQYFDLTRKFLILF